MTCKSMLCVTETKTRVIPSISTLYHHGEKSAASPKYSLTVMLIVVFCVAILFRNSSSSLPQEDVLDVSSSLSSAILSKTSSNTASGDFALARHESLGFFDDISSTEWKRMRERVHQVYPNVIGDPNVLRNEVITANRFFQDEYEPDFACRHERRIGQLGDGGKWVSCDNENGGIRSSSPAPPCLVYSVGSNGDVSFEAAIMKEIGPHCEIHSFDMADYSKEVEGVGAHFHQWGIAKEASRDKRGLVFKSLAETVKELGHTGRTIDIFKIDCEGCEWETFPSFFEAGVELRQVLIELHASNPDGKGAKQQPMPVPTSIDFFVGMYKHGYVIFHKEVNIKYWHLGAMHRICLFGIAFRLLSRIGPVV